VVVTKTRGWFDQQTALHQQTARELEGLRRLLKP
jgi:hypothetical protein